MSNKINTTTGNEVKDTNTTELEGKASSSTSQSGEMSPTVKLLVIFIGNLVVMGLLVTAYALVAHWDIGYTADKTLYMGLAALFTAAVLCMFLPPANKGKKESETSTEEQSVEAAKAEEVTDAKDEKPSNPLSNAAKFLLIGLGLIVTSALIGFGFALLR